MSWRLGGASPVPYQLVHLGGLTLNVTSTVQPPPGVRGTGEPASRVRAQESWPPHLSGVSGYRSDALAPAADGTTGLGVIRADELSQSLTETVRGKWGPH